MKRKSYLTIILALILGFALVRGVLAAAFQAQQGIATVSSSEIRTSVPAFLGEPVAMERFNTAPVSNPPVLHDEANTPIEPSEGDFGSAPQKLSKPHQPLPPEYFIAQRPSSNQAVLATLEIYVNYSDDWVAGDSGVAATVAITLTDGTDTYKDDAVVEAGATGYFDLSDCGLWASGDCPDIQPGDNLYAAITGANAEISPIGIINGIPDATSDVVTGTLNVEGFIGSLDVSCVVLEDPFPEIPIEDVPNGSTFTCNYGGIWDLQRGQTVMVNYVEPDGDMVMNNLTWPWVRANYAHDWIGADYPAGHTFWYTVTDDLGGYKSGGSGQTELSAGWGGDGFVSDYWKGGQPDIVPGDYVYFAADDGYSNVLEVGEVNGNLDVDNDILTGTISAPFAYSLTVECHPWGAWDVGLGDVQVKTSWAEPDGSVPYSCQWNPFSEWDIQPGLDIAAMYIEPDDDRVINVFQEPAPELGVEKWLEGGLGRPGGVLVYGIQYRNDGTAAGENVLIADTLPLSTTYADDTSGLPLTIGPRNLITWDLGTVQPGETEDFFVTLDVHPDTPQEEGAIPPNCATISTTTPWDWNPDNDEACSDPATVGDDGVDVGVSKGSEPNDPYPGQEFDYHIEWCNNRGAAAGPVVMTDTLPAEVTLLEWGESQPWMHYWSEISFDGQQLVLYAPGLPGDRCENVNLRVALNPEVPLETTLVNLVEITLADDEDPENNWFLEENTFAGEPRYDLAINKWFNSGVLVPGGQVEYFIDFSNHGNITTNVQVTDTLSSGLAFADAWWAGGTPMEGEPMPEPVIDGNLVTWNFGELEVNGWRGFHLLVDVDEGVSPGTELGNCVEIRADNPDAAPGDNSSCDTVMINPVGPNLAVEKWHEWHGEGQLGYSIRFANLGDQPVDDVLISDTLPLGTTPAGWFEMEFDDQRLINYIEASNAVEWNFSDIQPGETGWLYFNANLDFPGEPLRWYTNTVGITTHPEESNSGDNYAEDLAFSGGELRRVEFWLNQQENSSMWGEAVPDSPITVTTVHGEFYAWADPECDGCWNIDDAGPINPDDVVTVTAGEGILPVVVSIPNPIDVEVDTASNQVFGQIGGWFDLPVEVHGEWDGGYQETLTNGGGDFLAIYPDIPPRANGYIRFIDEVDFAEVIYHRPFYALDLVLEINYGHDWVQGFYEPGHTVWITVTESDRVTVKGLAELGTGDVPGWEGDTGFSTDWGGWLGDRPDLQAGDWVFGRVDNGYEAEVELGDVAIAVNTIDDTVDGAISAVWNPSPIEASCEIWAPEGPVIEFTIPPDGSPFQCDFGALEWQIEPGQTVAIAYREPDGHRVINTYDFPYMAANIGPWSDGDRHVFGGRTIPGSSIALTVTTETGGYLASTVVQSDPEGNFDTENNFPEGSLALWNIIWGDFGGGITDTLQVYPVGGEADLDTDVITVTAAGPPFFSVGLEYCWLGECDWIEMGEIGEGGQVTVDLMAERDFDIVPGTNFHAHLSVWNGHEVIYSWGIPAPELAVWKWTQSGLARPGGVLVYEIQFRNDGTGPAEEVQIVDTLPLSTTYAGDTSGYPVSGNADQITWDVGTVEAGEQVNFFVTLDVDPSVPIQEAGIDPNCLVISTSTEGDWDPDNNNFCSDPVDVDGDEIEVEIGVSKWAEPNDPAPGQEYNYTIEWCNNRGVAAGPVVLTDTLPVGVTLLEWGESQPWLHFWNLVSETADQLVLYAPGLPGETCENINLRVSLDPEIPLGTPIENLVEIDVAGDIDTENNWFLDQNTIAGWSRYDLGLSKGFHVANLTPGGYVEFWIDYSNHGNTTTYVTLTDTLPAGLQFHSAWWGSGTPNENQPLEPISSVGNELVFDLGELEVSGNRNFNILAEVEPDVQPPAELENCAVVNPDGPDAYPQNNTACYIVVVQPTGPNLMVEKWHEWHDEGQLGYSLRFSNVGDQPVSDVWITDTLPLGTTSSGEFDLEFDEQRLIQNTQNVDELIWVFDELIPGETGWIHFNLDLNQGGVPLQWYTNLVEISLPPGDPDPSNNHFEDVAFSGGEVRRVHIWLSDYDPSAVWGEAVAGSVVTVTTNSGVFTTTADPDCGGCWSINDAGTILPGEQVEVVAGAGLQPVLIDVPTPFTAMASSRSEEVWGQIDHLDVEWIEVDLFGGPFVPTQTDNDGMFNATLPDIPGDGEGQVIYITQVDFAEVIFHRYWKPMDLIMDVNYGPDWVQGGYDPGHTVWITVTESNSSTVKGTIELTTGPIPWWGGENGFHTALGSWSGDQPDIVPGDWVFGRVDNGFTTEVRVGAIHGVVDVKTDSITGWLDVPWYVGVVDPLEVQCEPWGGGPGAPIKYSTASPDGLSGAVPNYYCEWNPATEWDILVGQELAVDYVEPDGDRVMNVFVGEEYLVYLPLLIR